MKKIKLKNKNKNKILYCKKTPKLVVNKRENQKIGLKN